MYKKEWDALQISDGKGMTSANALGQDGMSWLYGYLNTAQLSRIVLNSSPPTLKQDYIFSEACSHPEFGSKKSHQLTYPARLQHCCCGNCSPPWATHRRGPLEMTPEGSSSSPEPRSWLCMQKNLMLAKFCPSSSPPDLLGLLLAQLLGAKWIKCDFLSSFWAKFSTGGGPGCEEHRVSSAPAKFPA